VHDLRNPLAALLGNVDLALLFQSGRDPSVLEALRQARRSGERLLSMVNTIIDVVRLEDGKLPIAPEACDLRQVVRTTAAEYAAHASRAELRLDIDLPQDPVEVRADPAVLVRIVENLLTNSLKHTPRLGSVRLGARRGRDAGCGELVVSDTGEGIPAAQLPNLFTKYGRVEGQRHTTRYDTGLGLVFCRLAVEAQGGAIEVASEVGRGTTFVVSLPAAAPDGRGAAAPAAVGGGG
jgi:signal transduction histidine kinase